MGQTSRILDQCPYTAAKALFSVLVALVAFIESGKASTAYTVTNTLGSGAGSFTQAVIDANANPNGIAPDTIKFAIPGAGLHTISTASTPAIADRVVIDGYSQSGSSKNTLSVGFDAVILIDLQNPGGSALRIGDDDENVEADNRTLVQGLRFSQSTVGVNASGVDSAQIIGCLAQDNDDWGVLAQNSAWLEVGGSAIESRCVIAGNTSGDATDAGIRVDFSDSVLVRNCYIGTTTNGLSADPNGVGVSVVAFSRGTTIGGSLSSHRNVISGNTVAGITVGFPTHGPIAIAGNYIGTDANGTAALGSPYGVDINRDSVVLGGNDSRLNERYLR